MPNKQKRPKRERFTESVYVRMQPSMRAGLSEVLETCGEEQSEFIRAAIQARMEAVARGEV